MSFSTVTATARRGLALAMLVLASGGALAAPSERDDPAPSTPRFAVDARIAPTPPTSSDGRFQITASAKLADEPSQRYQLKAITADCSNTIADAVFKDGFE